MPEEFFCLAPWQHGSKQSKSERERERGRETETVGHQGCQKLAYLLGTLSLCWEMLAERGQATL